MWVDRGVLSSGSKQQRSLQPQPPSSFLCKAAPKQLSYTSSVITGFKKGIYVSLGGDLIQVVSILPCLLRNETLPENPMPAVFVLAFGNIYSFNFLLSTWRSQGPGVCLSVCLSAPT